jgi:hypothetical protein
LTELGILSGRQRLLCRVRWFFVGVASGIRACSSKEKALKGPFLISSCNPDRLLNHTPEPIADIPPNLTRLQQAGDAEALPAALQTTGRRAGQGFTPS